MNNYIKYSIVFQIYEINSINTILYNNRNNGSIDPVYFFLYYLNWSKNLDIWSRFVDWPTWHPPQLFPSRIWLTAIYMRAPKTTIITRMTSQNARSCDGAYFWDTILLWGRQNQSLQLLRGSRPMRR